MLFDSSLSLLPGKSSKTPGKSSKTPSKTPTRGDRFIPNRSATNYELSSFMLTNSTTVDPDAELVQSPSKLEYQKLMSDNLNGNQLNSRILSYKNRPPTGPEGKFKCGLVYLTLTA